jgi:hypothetical protein
MFIFGVIMRTRVERLERSLANVEAMPDGKDSLYAQDLRGQIAAAKFLRDQTPTSMPEEKFFGGTRNPAAKKAV